jgi:hypothetical protein
MIYLSIYVYIDIYLYLFVYLCRERELEREHDCNSGSVAGWDCREAEEEKRMIESKYY